MREPLDQTPPAMALRANRADQADPEGDTTEYCVAVQLTVVVGVSKRPYGMRDRWWLTENVADWLATVRDCGQRDDLARCVDHFRILDVTPGR